MVLFGYLVILAIIVLVVFSVVDVVTKIKAVKNVKGPSYSALFLAIFNKTKDEDVFFQLQKYAKEFPGIYKAWFFNKLLVVTDDCDIIQRVLSSRELLHKPPILYNVLDFQFGLVGSEYPIWRRHRKLLNPTFNLKILESFIPVFVEKSKLLAEDMGKHLEEPDFDVMKIVMKYTLEAVFGTTMGFEGMSNAVVEKICSSLRKILTVIGIRIYYIYLLPQLIYKWTNCFNGIYQKEQKIRQYLYDFVDETILEKQTNFDGSLIQDEDSLTKPQLFINQLISLTEDKQRSIQLTNEEIRDECYIMVAGGTETTALSISYMCLLLAQNPTIQDKLYNEINEEYPSLDEPLTMKILNRLTSLDRAIKETMRLIPIVPLIVREVRNDFDLGPCTLKPGMLMLINIYALHRRKDIWGEDAEIYNPDRFLPENMTNKHSHSYIPFSAGARNCIGKFCNHQILLLFICVCLFWINLARKSVRYDVDEDNDDLHTEKLQN